MGCLARDPARHRLAGGGDVPVRRVAEVLEDGQTGYRVQAKGANQAVELMLNQAGQVIRSETTVREKKP